MSAKIIRHVGSTDTARDFFKCNERALANVALEDLDKAVQDAGFELISSQFYRFEAGGCGISYLAIISESHVAIHTSPENHGCIEITVHTCDIEGTSSQLSPEKKTALFFHFMEEIFKPKRIAPFIPRRRGVMVG